MKKISKFEKESTANWTKPPGTPGPKRNTVDFPSVKQSAKQYMADGKSKEVFMGRPVIRHSAARYPGSKNPEQYEEEPDLPLPDQMKELQKFHDETGGSQQRIPDVKSIDENFRSRNRRFFTG